MKLRKCKRGFFLILPVLGILIQATSCGTLLYPERRGQIKGQIDPAVAIMDGIGVFIFLIPGLFAFAVDFYTGAIYLPSGTSAESPIPSENGLPVVYNENPGRINQQFLEEFLYNKTGQLIPLDQDSVKVKELKNNANIQWELAKAVNQLGLEE